MPGAPDKRPLRSEPVAEQDDLDDFLADALEDERFAGAFEDAAALEALLRQLVTVRKQHGFTQKMVAAAMGTTQSAISELEGGIGDPRLTTLQRYARSIGCHLRVWLGSSTPLAPGTLVEQSLPAVRSVYPPGCSLAVNVSATSVLGMLPSRPNDWSGVQLGELGDGADFIVLGASSSGDSEVSAAAP